jgi:DNA-binding LacI/PurR family transcriptional regulator
MKRTPDIRAVARRAGVSIATVSRCLNEKRVSPAAEQRIRAAIKRTRLLAQSGRPQPAFAEDDDAGDDHPDITNPFFPAVVSGVEETARAARFALMLCNAGKTKNASGSA